MILAFLTRHAEQHYRHADGTPTGEYDNFRDSLKPLRNCTEAHRQEISAPKRLKAVRQAMIDAGLSRNVINQRVGRIVHVFKWAVSEEMVPPDVHHGLKTVSGLQKGRSRAKETDPIKPVAETFVDAIRPYVARQVWAMVELQRLTGMRPGEVVIMRTCDLDLSGKLWEYIPNRHKTEHHGKKRRIIIGPKAQAILQPWLRTDLSAHLFSPKEAMVERRGEQHRNPKTPMTPSQRARRPKKSPKRLFGDHYSPRTYHHAIRYACQKADIPIWGPNRLRHNAGTMIRKEFGLDVARAVLGHSDVDTTTIYAERDAGLAAIAMEKIG